MDDLRGEVAIVQFEATESRVLMTRIEGATTSAADLARQAAADAAQARTSLGEPAARVEKMSVADPRLRGAQ